MKNIRIKNILLFAMVAPFFCDVFAETRKGEVRESPSGRAKRNVKDFNQGQPESVKGATSRSVDITLAKLDGGPPVSIEHPYLDTPAGRDDGIFYVSDKAYGGTPLDTKMDTHEEAPDGVISSTGRESTSAKKEQKEILAFDPALLDMVYTNPTKSKNLYENMRQDNGPIEKKGKKTYKNAHNKAMKYYSNPANKHKIISQEENWEQIKKNHNHEHLKSKFFLYNRQLFEYKNKPLNDYVGIEYSKELKKLSKSKTFFCYKSAQGKRRETRYDEKVGATAYILSPKYQNEAKAHPEKAANQAVDLGKILPSGEKILIHDKRMKAELEESTKNGKVPTKGEKTEYYIAPAFDSKKKDKTVVDSVNKGVKKLGGKKIDTEKAKYKTRKEENEQKKADETFKQKQEQKKEKRIKEKILGKQIENKAPVEIDTKSKNKLNKREIAVQTKVEAKFEPKFKKHRGKNKKPDTFKGGSKIKTIQNTEIIGASYFGNKLGKQYGHFHDTATKIRNSEDKIKKHMGNNLGKRAVRIQSNFVGRLLGKKGHIAEGRELYNRGKTGMLDRNDAKAEEARAAEAEEKEQETDIALVEVSKEQEAAAAKAETEAAEKAADEAAKKAADEAAEAAKKASKKAAEDEEAESTTDEELAAKTSEKALKSEDEEITATLTDVGEPGVVVETMGEDPLTAFLVD